MILNDKDYDRAYKVINSIIISEGGNPATSCIFFAAFGAAIISHHYKLSTTVKSGLAVYHFGSDDADNDRIAFGKKLNNGRLSGEYESFHCWIEVNGWVVDFMTPAFRDLPNVSAKVPSKIFQKPLTEMATSYNDIKKVGGFYLESAQKESTIKHMAILSTSRAYKDLESICVQWFKKEPEKILPGIITTDAKGAPRAVLLHGFTAEGCW